MLLFGGQEGATNAARNFCAKYDVNQNSWTILNSLPTVRGTGTVLMRSGKLQVYKLTQFNQAAIRSTRGLGIVSVVAVLLVCDASLF